MINWDETKLREFLSHDKCRMEDACYALAGFQFPVDHMREGELIKLWHFSKTQSASRQLFKSTEDFIGLAIEKDYYPPWLAYAIEHNLYTPNEKVKKKLSSQLSEANDLSTLFDPVSVTVLEITFPSDGRWENWAKRAQRNGLVEARVERGKFNPYKAALWLLDQNQKNYTLELCKKRLVKLLPDRSLHKKDLLVVDDEKPVLARMFGI